MTTTRLRNLYDQRATAWATSQEIRARLESEGRDATKDDEDTVAFRAALDDVERIGQEIEDEERSARLDAAMRRPDEGQRSTNPKAGAGAPEDSGEAAYRDAFLGFVRRGMVDLPAEARQVLVRGLQTGDPELRALAAGTGSAGGYTVPTEFLSRLQEVRKAYGGIAQHAETITTADGAPLQWATNDDTANKGAILAENTQVTEQDTTFGTKTLGAYMYTSKMVRVSLQLLQDSQFDIEGFLARKLGERIGRAAAEHFAVGTGTGQPEGLVTGLTLGVTSAASGAIGYDDFVEIEHSIDPAYRTDNARYIVHDSVIKAVRKLKDSQGRPLWAPAISVGAPSTINGRPYTVDNSLAALAASSKSVIYGDIRAAYLIRQVAGAQTMRLSERYADYLQVAFLGFQRLDAKVQDTQAAAVLTAKA